MLSSIKPPTSKQAEPPPGSDAAIMKAIVNLQKQAADLGRKYADLLKQDDQSPSGRALREMVEKQIEAIKQEIAALQAELEANHLAFGKKDSKAVQATAQAAAPAPFRFGTVGTVVRTSA